MKILSVINGQPVCQENDGSVTFVGEACVDADGSPRAYGPHNTGLDFTANAGHDGNWWGIATDSHGTPIIQGSEDPAPGFYISTTSLQHPEFPLTDPRRYVDSEKVSFIVVPSIIARRAIGVVLGCKAEIKDLRSGATVSAVVADLGPDSHLGEISIACANALAINPDAKHGGCSQRVFQYTFWPGIPAQGFTLHPLA